MEDASVGLIGLFSSAFISSTIAPGGSEAVLAYMVSTGEYPVGKLIVIASIGNTLGAMTTWFLGWVAAKKFPVETMLDRNKMKGVALVRKWGGWALLFSWLPVVGDGFCFAGGWLKMALLPAILAIITGKVLRYMFVAYIFV